MEDFAEYGKRLAEIESGVSSNPVSDESEAAVEAQPQSEVVETEQTETEQVTETTQPEQVQPLEDKPQLHKIKVNGKEKEVPYEDLLALAQKGDDYSYRMEQLRAQRLELDAYKPFVDALQNPQFREYVASFGKQQQPVSDDPVDQFREEIKQRVLEELKPRVEQPVQQLQQQVIASQIQARVESDDPDHSIRKEMWNYVNSLPGHLEFIPMPDGSRRIDPSRSNGAKFREYMALDTNPQEFVATYSMFRDRVKNSAPQQTQPVQQQAKPTAVTTRAPILEGAGAEVQESGAQTKRQEMQRLRDRAMGGDLAAAGRLLEITQSKRK